MIRVIGTDISGADAAAWQILYDRASPERKERAGRYRGREDALRCVTAEALLRYALGTDRYQVQQEPDGKPRIPERPDFHYNLSHSGKWVVIAYGGSPVGVDVEQIRPDTKIRTVAERFFAPEEVACVLEKPEESRDRFFEIWTGKESYIKYLGTGLKQDLRSFSVKDPKLGVRFHRKKLSGGYWLTLCSTEQDWEYTELDLRELLKDR